MIRFTAAAFAAALSVAAAPALAETFPVKMASYQKGYFKGFTSVALPSYNFTLITANQATAAKTAKVEKAKGKAMKKEAWAMKKQAKAEKADAAKMAAATPAPAETTKTTTARHMTRHASAAPSGRMVTTTTKTGKKITYNCSKQGNMNKKACKG